MLGPKGSALPPLLSAALLLSHSSPAVLPGGPLPLLCVVCTGAL